MALFTKPISRYSGVDQYYKSAAAQGQDADIAQAKAVQQATVDPMSAITNWGAFVGPQPNSVANIYNQSGAGAGAVAPPPTAPSYGGASAATALHNAAYGGQVDQMASQASQNLNSNFSAQQDRIRRYKEQRAGQGSGISAQNAIGAVSSPMEQQQIINAKQTAAAGNVASQNANPSAISANNSVTPKSDYRFVDDNMIDAANKVTIDMLTGKTFDPIKQREQEALARMEQQRRSETAGDINRFGFGGQGIGDQIANASEQDLMKNRFDRSLVIDIAENQMKRDGLGELRSNIDTERQLTGIDRDKVGIERDRFGIEMDKTQNERNKVGLEQDRFNLENSANELRGKVGADFASYAQTHLNLRDMSPEQIAADTATMSLGQKLWEQNGGTGKVDPSWVKNQLDAVYDPRLSNQIAMQKDQISEAVRGGFLSQEDGQFLTDSVDSGLTMFLTRGEDGKVTFDWDLLKEYGEFVSGGSGSGSGSGSGAGSGSGSGTASFSSGEGTESTGNVSEVIQAIEEGKSFDTDRFDGALSAWAAANVGKSVNIGGVDYQVVSYTPSTKGGEKGKLVLKDPSDGREVYYYGTESQLVTDEQRKEANKTGAFSIMSGGVNDLGTAVKEGDTKAIIRNILTLGTGISQIIDFFKNRREKR